MKRLRTLTILLLTLVITSPASSADHQKETDVWKWNEFPMKPDAWKSTDFKTALKQLKPLAEQGHAHAQYNLGQMYFHGRGVPNDRKKAAEWFTLAAKQGFAEAQFALGLMYRVGRESPGGVARLVENWRIGVSS